MIAQVRRQLCRCLGYRSFGTGGQQEKLTGRIIGDRRLPNRRSLLEDHMRIGAAEAE